MISKKLSKITESIRQRRKEATAILESKNEDYASKDNFFKNFKEAAIYASMRTGKEFTAEDAIIILQGIKLSRYGNIKGKQPKNESKRGTEIDLLNYFDFEFESNEKEG